MNWKTDLEKLDILENWFYDISIEKSLDKSKYFRDVVFTSLQDTSKKVRIIDQYISGDIRTREGKALMIRIAFCGAGEAPGEKFILEQSIPSTVILDALRTVDEARYWELTDLKGEARESEYQTTVTRETQEIAYLKLTEGSKLVQLLVDINEISDKILLLPYIETHGHYHALDKVQNQLREAREEIIQVLNDFDFKDISL